MYRNFDLETLEKQYSPSSCVDDISVYIDQYIVQSEQALNRALASNSVIRNLQYGADEDETIDLFLPTVGNNKKLQVYIHGGYWQELTKKESSFAANNFQEHGCFFAVINYSLAPKANISEIVDQNRKAIAWLIENAEIFGFDASEIYLSGSSAGAHLAMLMTQTNWQSFIKSSRATVPSIKGVTAVSGIYDLSPIKETYIDKPLALTHEQVTMQSPLFQLQQCECDVLFAFGNNETSEFKRQSFEMFEHLYLQNIETSLIEVDNRNHFDVILDLADSESELFKKTASIMAIAV